MSCSKRSFFSYAIVSAAISFALTGCGSDNDGYSSGAESSKPATPKNIIVMINDGASFGTWDMAAYWEAGVKANALPIFQDMDVRFGMRKAI